MKITVPDSLADITVKQYKELAEIKHDQESNEWIIEAVCVLCQIEKSIVEKLTINELSQIADIIKKLNDEDHNNQTLKEKIEYKGKRYGFHPNLSKLTVGEFADLESYCADGFFTNINEILGILYRPIAREGGDFYTIEEYTGDHFPNYWDELKMDVVLGAVNFFLSIGVSLTNGLANYLAEREKLTLLRRNGDGM